MFPTTRVKPGKITVDQLLNHTSGLQQDIGFSDNPNDVPPIIAKINADLLSNDELVKLIAARPLRFAPGTAYGYSSDGYAVLGAIIEHVTGESYWQALTQRILKPAGMTDTVPALLTPLVPKRALGYRQGFGGIENAMHIGATPGAVSTRPRATCIGGNVHFTATRSLAHVQSLFCSPCGK